MAKLENIVIAFLREFYDQQFTDLAVDIATTTKSSPFQSYNIKVTVVCIMCCPFAITNMLVKGTF